MVRSTQIARLDGRFTYPEIGGSTWVQKLTNSSWVIGLMLAASVDDEQVFNYLFSDIF